MRTLWEMQGEIGSKWCRENLNELAAEKELRTNRKGTFLVWRCRSPVDLYLSYCDHNDLPRHLPIKQLGRFFYLEGVKFRSLSELVVYHLTTRQLADNPVNVLNSHKRDKLEATHIALTDMEYPPGQPTFCVSRGDLLAEVGRLDDRWLLAKHLPSDCMAFFDLTNTSILSDMDAAPDALPYFHECTGEERDDELVQRLAEGGRGSFLIRQSHHSSGAYALLVHTGDKIDKFLLEEVKGGPPSTSSHKDNNNGCASAKSTSSSAGISGWRLCSRVFPSISQIVHRYSFRGIQADVCLTHAILSQKEEEGCSAECSSVSSPSTSSTVLYEDTVRVHDMPETDRGGSANEKVVVASLAALYKNREDKEWRACTVTLYEHAGSAILRIGDTSRGDRHVLVLHHTELVCLHETVFSREATVFLAPLQNEPGVFLAFEPFHFFYTWFHLLRRYTVQRRTDVALGSPTSSSPSMSYYTGEREEMSVLSIHVDKYKGALLKADVAYRVGISVNGVGMANTLYQTPTNGSSVVFDAHFLLVITSWSCNVQLTISASGKSRPTAVSSVMGVPMGSMSSMTHSSSSSSSASFGGSTAVLAAVTTGAERKASGAAPPAPFFVTATRQRVVVLSRDAYTPLVDTLLDEVIAVAEWASGRLPHAQRNLLCSVMVSLVWPNSLRALIERTLGKSIAETGGENMLRQDSFASCLITAALRMSGKTMLEASLAEERPKKEALWEDWIVGILAEVARVPAVSLVLACVATTVAAHLPAGDKEHVVRRAISAAFILRFANPLIISALAASGGPALARGVQTAANAATMHTFARDPSGEGTPTRLFDLFERVRDSAAAHAVMVDTYERAPEQYALLCHLLALALTATSPPSCRQPPSTISSSASSSSTVTTTSSSSSGGGSMAMSSMASSLMSMMTADSSSVTLTAATAATTESAAEPACLSASYTPVSSGSSTPSRPELSPLLGRLLELHRT